MSDSLYLQQLRELHYPGKVDVTEAVMAQIRKKPVLAPLPTKTKWGAKRITAVAAACVAVVVALNFVLVMPNRYNSTQMAKDLAAIYDYDDNSTYYEAYLVDALFN